MSESRMREISIQPDPVPRPEYLKGVLTPEEKALLLDVQRSKEPIYLKIKCGKAVSSQSYSKDDIELLKSMLQSQAVKKCGFFIDQEHQMDAKEENQILAQFRPLFELIATLDHITSIAISPYAKPLFEELFKVPDNFTSITEVLLFQPATQNRMFFYGQYDEKDISKQYERLNASLKDQQPSGKDQQSSEKDEQPSHRSVKRKRYRVFCVGAGIGMIEEDCSSSDAEHEDVEKRKFTSRR